MTSVLYIVLLVSAFITNIYSKHFYLINSGIKDKIQYPKRKQMFIIIVPKIELA